MVVATVAYAGATQYEYDSLNRLTRVVYPDATTVEYTYDEVGNRLRKITTNPNPACPADFNGDGDVDQDDYTVFESCASGSSIPHDGSPTCQTSDFDDDNDVDQEDFAVFQRCISGQGTPGDPNCAD